LSVVRVVLLPSGPSVESHRTKESTHLLEVSARARYADKGQASKTEAPRPLGSISGIGTGAMEASVPCLDPKRCSVALLGPGEVRWTTAII
jgi:hypothetical protein